MPHHTRQSLYSMSMTKMVYALLFFLWMVSAASSMDLSFLYPERTYVPLEEDKIVWAPPHIIQKYSVTESLKIAAKKWLKNIQDDPFNTMPGKDTLGIENVIQEMINGSQTRFFFWDMDHDGIAEYIDNGFDASWQHILRIFKKSGSTYTLHMSMSGFFLGYFTSPGTAPIIITSQGFCCGDTEGWLMVNIPPTKSGHPAYTRAEIITSDVNMVYPSIPLPPVQMSVTQPTMAFTLPNADSGTPFISLQTGALVTRVGAMKFGTLVFCKIKYQKGLVLLPSTNTNSLEDMWVGWILKKDLRKNEN